MEIINQRTIKLFDNLSKKLQSNITKVYIVYEKYFGIKELKEFQLHVLNAEKAFADASKARREAQTCILKLQNDLKRLRQKLDSTNRADERYLNLLTEEHKFIKEELNLMESLRNSEENEREKFTFFSNKLRESQNFEKIRQEKLKYISLIGSVIGALFGIIATSINYRLHQHDILNLTESLERQVDQDKEIKSFITEMKKIVNAFEANSDFLLEDKILKELKLMNNHLEFIHKPQNGHLEYTRTDNKLNIMLVGLTLLSVSIIFNLFVNRIN